MDEIVIHDSALDGFRIKYEVSVPRSLKKYFRSFNVFVEYDESVDVDTSILNMPILTAVLPLAWLTRSDIRIESIDKVFKRSVDNLKQEFMDMYPKADFNTNIHANKLVENRIQVDSYERTALLFSGGVDCTYSLITNLKENTRLIMYWGVEGYPYPKRPEYWKQVISTYSDFAKRKGLTLNLVKTNILELLNERRIEHDFHDIILNGTLWIKLLHWILLPLAAPLSIGRFDRLLIAASHAGHEVTVPACNDKRIDEKVAWADLQVSHDGYIPRIDKILGPIKEYLEKDDLIFRVCLKRDIERGKLNCSSCEKCFRTIVGLILIGFDPNKCGFEVDQSTFKAIKDMFTNEQFGHSTLNVQWKPLQRMAAKSEHDIHGSLEFFKWFRDFDLFSRVEDVEKYRKLYHKLPYQMAKILDELYETVGINIHTHNPAITLDSKVSRS